MGEKRGTKALEFWCRRITEGYPGVNVQNMTTSWKDGLAFCAMVHHFRPDLIDFDSLDKNDIYGNNELAFKTAEQHLGIPALLDAEDMTSCSIPDRLSILTYLSQFYQTFGGSSPSPLAINRATETTETVDDGIVSRSESPKQKVASGLCVRRDLCVICGLPVFLAEKLVVAHDIYHRTCFRCARCNNQLTHGNYYETEEGQFCCETCPDEDATPSTSTMQKHASTISSEISGKTADSNANVDSMNQEILFVKGAADQRVFNSCPVKSLKCEDYTIPDLIAQTSQLKVNFVSNYLLSEKDERIVIADGSSIKKNPGAVDKHFTNSKESESTSKMVSTLTVSDKGNQWGRREERDCSVTFLELESQNTEEAIKEVRGDSMKTKDYVRGKVNSQIIDDKQKIAPFCNVTENKSTTLVTRMDDTEQLSSHINEYRDAKSCPSLVQKRLMLFEARNTKDQIENREKEYQKADVLDSAVQNTEHSISDRILKESITDREKLSPLSRDGFRKLNSSKLNKTFGNHENISKSGVKNLNMERDKWNSNTMIGSEAPSSFPWNEFKPLTTIHANKKDREDENLVTSVEETSQVYAGDADANINEDYPEDLNPFKSDEKRNNDADCIVTVEHHEAREERKDKKMEVIQLKLPARSNFKDKKSTQQYLTKAEAKRRLVAPQINLNPFWSDEDDHNSDLECKVDTYDNIPLTTQRTTRRIQEIRTDDRQLDWSNSSAYTSSNSLTNSESGTAVGSTYRKKKPAPLPPNINEVCCSGQQRTSVMYKVHSSAGCHDSTAHTTPKMRKAKPAPPPPMVINTLYDTTSSATLNTEESSLDEPHSVNVNQDVWADKKIDKDEANRSRQSLTHISYEENCVYKSVTDKSTQGKWRRKKTPAPLCPIPHRRKIKVMSLMDVKLELDEIELQHQGLEKQGVRLEQLIRNKCESGLTTDDVSLGTDVEELVLELFALVNEKNELFRRQAELMLLRRQQRLEEEHVEVEYQIRCLMSQHVSTKTNFDKQREEVLIQRLVDIVEKRNEIVECLEMDRRREIEEDRSIHKHMGLLAAKNKNQISSNEVDVHRRSTKKSKLIEKKSKKDV